MGRKEHVDEEDGESDSCRKGGGKMGNVADDAIGQKMTKETISIVSEERVRE